MVELLFKSNLFQNLATTKIKTKNRWVELYNVCGWRHRYLYLRVDCTNLRLTGWSNSNGFLHHCSLPFLILLFCPFSFCFSLNDRSICSLLAPWSFPVVHDFFFHPYIKCCSLLWNSFLFDAEISSTLHCLALAMKAQCCMNTMPFVYKLSIRLFRIQGVS